MMTDAVMVVIVKAVMVEEAGQDFVLKTTTIRSRLNKQQQQQTTL